MRRSLVILATLVATACATTARLVPIAYSFADEPAQRQVTVSYTNTSKRLMCLLPEHWPNRAGWVDQAEGRVFLEIGERRVSMKDFNTGYCPGCATRVDPGSTLTATIPYERFGLPEDLVPKSKILRFSPVAFPCERE